MNYKKTLEIDESFDLFEKYYREGNKGKVKEYLNQVRKLKNEDWEDNKKEIIRVMQEVGLSTEEITKELNDIE